MDFSCRAAVALGRNPRWWSHLLSRIEADPPVGFAWSAWSSCYHSGASLGFLVEIPPLLIVFFGSTGGRTSRLLGFGLHFTVSRSLLPSLLSLCWLIKQAIVGVEYYIQWSWLVLWNLLLYVRLIYTSSCVCAAVIRLWNKILANLFELVDCCFRDKYWLVLLLLSATIHNHDRRLWCHWQEALLISVHTSWVKYSEIDLVKKFN